jgi:hypothetical protein
VQHWSVGLGLARYAIGLRSFAREPVSCAAARRIVEQRLRDREVRFQAMIERAVYGNPSSPYVPLLRAAGCEPGDVSTMVRANGVEGALARLRDAGVYVTYEEFKGRAAMVRGGQHLMLREEDFDNPLITPHYPISSGGTGGRATRIMIDVEYLADRAPHWALWLAGHDLQRHSVVFVSPRYPASVNRQLICAKIGMPPVRWYATGCEGSVSYRLATTVIHALARQVAGLPAPTHVTLAEAPRIARELASLTRDGGGVSVVTATSTAVRLSATAGRGGAVAFLVGGEPLTATRRATIEASGARVIPNYGTSEVGTIASQCPHRIAPDEVHVARDMFAVLQRPRSLPDGSTVGALLLTTLLPTTPKILLNTEIGDHGEIDSHSCGCVFGQLGFDQRLHTIRSFVKLTGEGVTFSGSDLARLIEHVLPGRFGGTPVDYQIVELQDPIGLPRYELRVSPEIGPVDEASVVTTLLQELAKLRPTYAFMVDQWAQTGAVRVSRERPLVSSFGKVQPFRTLNIR